MSFIIKGIFAGLLAASALTVSGNVAAADLSPGYVGGDIGVRNSYKLDCISGLECDKKANRSGRIYAGYTLGSNEFLGKENIGSIEFSNFLIGSADGGIVNKDGVATQGRGKVKGVALVHSSAMKLGNDFSLVTRVGASYAHGTVDYATTAGKNDYGRGGKDSRNTFGLTYGVGMAYALDKNWSLNADWNYVPVKFSDKGKNNGVNMFSLGAAYHF